MMSMKSNCETHCSCIGAEVWAFLLGKGDWCLITCGLFSVIAVFHLITNKTVEKYMVNCLSAILN